MTDDQQREAVLSAARAEAEARFLPSSSRGAEVFLDGVLFALAALTPVQPGLERKVPHDGPGHPYGDAAYCGGCLAEREKRAATAPDDDDWYSHDEAVAMLEMYGADANRIEADAHRIASARPVQPDPSERDVIIEALNLSDHQDYEFPDGYAAAILRGLARVTPVQPDPLRAGVEAYLAELDHVTAHRPYAAGLDTARDHLRALLAETEVQPDPLRAGVEALLADAEKRTRKVADVLRSFGQEPAGDLGLVAASDLRALLDATEVPRERAVFA